MPPSIALCAAVVFILWLFWRDSKTSKVSAAMWIPLAWVFVIGSRPVSIWIGDTGLDTADGGMQDTPLDKAVFGFLLLAGLVTLARRRINWPTLFRRNKWVLIYFLYLGLSVLWSDESFTSLKRWVKDFGNVLMVLIVLTDSSDDAVRAFLARCAYLFVPLSVVVIKYFPGVSRRYDVWTHQPGFVGISTAKNLLGMSLFVCAVSLAWMWIGEWKDSARERDKITSGVYLFLLALTAWLLYMAKSSTALVCTLLGVGLLFALKSEATRRQVRYLGMYALTVAGLVVILQTSGVWKIVVKEFAEAVGRDPTLHGRSEIWAAVLAEDINPVLGTGFYSFWSKERNERLSATYYYQLGEAHNGYIETYLNSGLLGLVLFAAVVVSAGRRIQKEILQGSDFGTLRLALLLCIAGYGLSESIFNRLVHLWFAFLLAVLDHPRRRRGESAEVSTDARNLVGIPVKDVAGTGA